MISAFNKNPKLILPGSGIRAEVLHPRQETPSPYNQLKFSSKILSCRVWTIHNFQNGENPKVGFWRAVLKMELWIWPFLCSIFLSLSIFFYPLKYPINFQTEKAPAFTLQPKHPFPEKENFVTYDLLFSSGKKWNVVKVYWSTLLHFCFMIGYRFSLCVKLRCKAKSFPLIQSWFKHSTAHIVFLKSFNILYILVRKLGLVNLAF